MVVGSIRGGSENDEDKEVASRLVRMETVAIAGIRLEEGWLAGVMS